MPQAQDFSFYEMGGDVFMQCEGCTETFVVSTLNQAQAVASRHEEESHGEPT